MALAVEVLLTAGDLPLVELAGSIPGAEISIENAVVLRDRRFLLLVSIPADARGGFEAELDEQDEVVDATAVGQTLDRWFYQLVVDERPSLYDAHDPTEIDAVLLGATVTGEGGVERMLFADREEFGEFRRRCDSAGIPFSVRAVSPDPETDASESRFGLTDRQYEALTVAFSRGYYDSPRRASTADVADRLEISAAAASDLLRRAERRLVRQAVESDRHVNGFTS